MKTQILQVTGPHCVEIIPRELPDEPEPGILYLQSEYLGISAGTELNTYRGGVNWHTGRDERTGLFHNDKQNWEYPAGVGYATVGRVLKVGEGVTRWKPGDRVFTTGYHGDVVATFDNRTFAIPSGVDARACAFLQLIRTALNIVHHAQISAGDIVVVFGLGPVGLLSMQIARLSGAGRIACFDPIAQRRKLALDLGADLALDPLKEDAGPRIFDWNGGRGADAAIECAASSAALQQATRVVGPLGRVVLGSMPGRPAEFHFGQEVHFNGIQIRGANVMRMPPHLGPLWDLGRQMDYSAELITRLRLAELITHEFPFKEAQSAYDYIDKNPQEVISAVFKV